MDHYFRVTILAVVISLLWSAPLYFKGIEGIEITKPPWFLLWLYPLENIFGVAAIAYTTGLVIILLAAVPMVTCRQKGNYRSKKKKENDESNVCIVIYFCWSYGSRLNFTINAALLG
jgi:hypothetical protein